MNCHYYSTGPITRKPAGSSALLSKRALERAFWRPPFSDGAQVISG